MIDKNIKRFCELIEEINEVNKFIDKKRHNYYNGGYTFEEAYEYEIQKLVDLQDEVKVLLTKIL